MLAIIIINLGTVLASIMMTKAFGIIFNDIFTLFLYVAASEGSNQQTGCT